MKPSTERAYKADTSEFLSWCEERRLVAIPAEPSTVAWYLLDRARTLKPASVARRMSSIARLHPPHSDPTKHPSVRSVMRDIRNATPEQDRSRPITLEELSQLAGPYSPDNSHREQRDRALLLVGFWGGYKRGELAALTVDAVGPAAVGRASIREDYLCPVRAVDTWLESAGIVRGPIFRTIDRHGNISQRAVSGRAIQEIVLRLADARSIPGRVTSQSMRYGLVSHLGDPITRIAPLVGYSTSGLTKAVSRHQDTARR
jgi:integrase